MAKELALIDQIPQYLAKYDAPTDAPSEYDVPVGMPFARLGYKGKVFSVWYEKENHPLLNEQGYSIQYLDVIIVKGKPKWSKVFYLGQYEDGRTDPPDCSSLDGIVPDAGVPHPQCDRCSACPNNVFKTAADGKSKACRDNKRYAFVPRGDVENERFGGPVLGIVPPGSLQTFDAYVKDMERRLGRNCLHKVYTRLSFDVGSAYPMFNFNFAGYVPEDELQIVMEWREDAQTERVLFLTAQEDEDKPAAPPAPPAPARTATGGVVVKPQPPAAAVTARPAPPPSPRPRGRPAATTQAAPPPVESSFDPDAALRALIDPGNIDTDKLMASIDGDFQIPS